MRRRTKQQEQQQAQQEQEEEQVQQEERMQGEVEGQTQAHASRWQYRASGEPLSRFARAHARYRNRIQTQHSTPQQPHWCHSTTPPAPLFNQMVSSVWQKGLAHLFALLQKYKAQLSTKPDFFLGTGRKLKTLRHFVKNQ